MKDKIILYKFYMKRFVELASIFVNTKIKMIKNRKSIQAETFYHHEECETKHILFANPGVRINPYYRLLGESLDMNCSYQLNMPKVTLKAALNQNEDINPSFNYELNKRKIQILDIGFSWPIVSGLLKVLYSCRFKRIFIRFDFVFKRQKIDAVCLWNGEKIFERAISEAAKKNGVKVLYFENGLLPKTTVIDSHGVNAKNSLPKNADFYTELNLTDFKLIKSSLEVRDSNKLDYNNVSDNSALPEKFIFVPFQVYDDSQILINSPRLKSMNDLYSWLEFCSINNPSIMFVVKEHPNCLKTYPNLLKKNSNIIFSHLNTEFLIKESVGVITINSTVGIEALLFEKNVVVLGNACYKINGLVMSACHKQELSEKAVLMWNQSWSFDNELRRAFLIYLKEFYLVDGSWKKPDEQHVESVERKILSLINQ